MKTKSEFTVRLDGELYKKLLYVAGKENGGSLNNHMLHMIRQNVSYYEKVHGKLKPQNLAGINIDVEAE